MPRPFNYLQFSESGITGSGIVAAYRGVQSGFFTPIGMFSTPRGFLVAIGDYLESFDSVPSYSIGISGALTSGNLDAPTYSVGFSGNFYPLSRDTGTLGSQFTGSVVSGTKDDPSYGLTFTGTIISGTMDSPSYDVSFSGRIDPFLTDFPSLNMSFTGNFISGLGEQPSYQVAFSGNIVKFERDEVLLDADISSITWRRGYPLDTETYEETGSLDIDISFICWSVSAC